MSVQTLRSSLSVVLLLSLAACNNADRSQTPTETSGSTKVATNTSAGQPTPAVKKYDGPFGLAAGISPADLKNLGFVESDAAPGVFTGKPPKPLDGADSYFVMATPTTGVCRIRATVDVDTVNGSGDQLKAKADQLAETMGTKYGKHSSKVTYIGEDVYKRNPQYWMLGLKEESVMYAYDWSAGKTEKSLPDGLANIEVSANATSTSQGYIAIQYTYGNFSQCQGERKQQQATSL